MSSPEFDWSFSDAPDEDSPPGASAPPPTDPSDNKPRPLHGPWLSRRQRRLIGALAALAALAGLGLWLFMRLGLQRLETQLSAQIVYEDGRAQAGDVPAVLALQASGEAAWRDGQAARVRLGLAAPLPAGDLQPAGHPPRLVHLEPLGGDLFAATVSRDYVDAAGQTQAFDLVQRYRNVSPGGWERLPPDTAALTATTPFEGQRLSVTVPTADLPWLGPALLQADDLIVRACADWGGACPHGLRLVASFGVAQELSAPALTAGERASGSPQIFFLSPAPARDRLLGYTLATPLLAGRPHDAAAQAALARSISIQLLGDFAGEVSGSARADDDYFLDALVARAEVRRLGASAAAQRLAPQDYINLAVLWAAAGQPRTPGGWRTDLSARREAFDFLNDALAGQPVSVDGQLLLSLRHGGGQGVDEWLASTLGRGALSLPGKWNQQALAAFVAHPVADWTRYDGLVLACNDGVYQVQNGSVNQRMWQQQTPELAMSIGSVSPDGRYADYAFSSILSPAAGVTNSAPSPWTTLVVLDLVTGNYPRVFEAPVINTYGWSAADELIYTVNSSRLDAIAPADELVLRAYHADTGISQALIPDRVVPDGANRPGLWSADHNRLLLSLASPPQTSLAVLTFRPVLQLRRLPNASDAAALSPDGRQVAYIMAAALAGGSDSGLTLDAGINWLHVLDLASGDVTRIAATNDLDLPRGTRSFWDPLWSPDGSLLAWHAVDMNRGGYVLSAPPGGGPARVWGGSAVQPLAPVNFSPDGRYLAAGISQAMLNLDQYWLFERQTATVQPPLTGWAHSMLWTPNGHRLVIAGTAGVSALDPASGDWEWLEPWPACQLRW